MSQTTIYGCLKTNITDIKTGNRDRYHIVTETTMLIYNF